MEKLTVLKVGGAVVEDPEALDAFLDGFAALPGLKVLVHGGGRAATKVAAQLGVPTRMVEGRRITDADMLRVVTMVYGGLVNKGVVAALQARGVNALGLTGADLGCMRAVKRPVKDIDYGFVGDMESVDTSILADLVARGVVPVMAPLSFDGKGSLLNTNADTIASSVAKALAERFEVTLVYCFEKAGVLKDPDDDASVIPLITKESFAGLASDGTVSGGMLPKLQNAFEALESGVKEVRITKADAPESGTRIVL
ncbi:MAG: acetylglutamate kinase [Bacteroidales bacterium]|nr:acetylglutamate kinase [Bacteroidales bacterium]